MPIYKIKLPTSYLHICVTSEETGGTAYVHVSLLSHVSAILSIVVACACACACTVLAQKITALVGLGKIVGYKLCLSACLRLRWIVNGCMYCPFWTKGLELNDNRKWLI